MIKTTIISGTDQYGISDRVNEFIANHNVIGFEFQTNGTDQVHTVYSVLIVYKDSGDE